MSYKIISESFFTKPGSKRGAEGIKENEDSFIQKKDPNPECLKSVLLVDGSNTDETLSGGKKQGKIISELLIQKDLLDFSTPQNPNPSGKKDVAYYKTELHIKLSNIFSDLLTSDFEFGSLPFNCAIAGFFCDEDNNLYAVSKGDVMLYGVFEKKIIPLSLDTRGKLNSEIILKDPKNITEDEAAKCPTILNVTQFSKNYEVMLGALCGVFLCSDGFLGNNSEFGYKNSAIFYTNLMQILNIHKSVSSATAKKYLETFLNKFPSKDDATLIYLEFKKNEFQAPFYLNRVPDLIKKQTELPSDLKYRFLPRILLISPLDTQSTSRRDVVFQQREYNRTFEGIKDQEILDLASFFAEKVESPQLLTTFENLSLVRNVNNQYLAAGKDLLSNTFDVSHLLITPAGFAISEYPCINQLPSLNELLPNSYKNLLTVGEANLNPFWSTGANFARFLDVSSFDYVFFVVESKYWVVISTLFESLLSGIDAHKVNIIIDAKEGSAIKNIAGKNMLYDGSGIGPNENVSAALNMAFLFLAEKLSTNAEAQKCRFSSAALKELLMSFRRKEV